MKILFKLFAVFAVIVVVLVAVIKFVQRCSWKEAVGILEEFCNEMRTMCCSCCSMKYEEKESPEEA